MPSSNTDFVNHRSGADSEVSSAPQQKVELRGRAIILLAKIVVSASILFWLFHRVGWYPLVAHLSVIDIPILAVALFALMLQFLVLMAGWQICLRFLGGRLSYGKVLKISVISLFFNQVIPASIGGMAARTVMAQRSGVPIASAASSVVLDRLCNLAALGAISLIGLALLYNLHLDEFSYVLISILATLGVMAAGIFLLWNADRFLKRMPDWLPVRAARRLGRNFRLFLSAPLLMVKAVGWGIVWHGLSIAALYFIGRAIGIEIGIYDFLAVVPLALLMAMAPISIAGWGVREGLLVALLGVVGVPTSQALALSLTFGASMLLTRLSGVAVWILDGSGSASEKQS